MKVLLTGAGGFIGSHLARLILEDGVEILALVQPEEDLSRLEGFTSGLQILSGDLQDTDSVEKLLKENRPDLCIHLAWYVEPGKYLESPQNLDLIGASVHLAYRLAEAGCKRFIGIGTCFEYDLFQGILSEESIPRPNSLYATCKLATSAALQRLFQGSKMQVAWLRLFYLYGPFEDPRRLIPHVITSLLKGQEAKTTGGKQVRDYLHVEDVARAIWAVAQSQAEGIVNIGSGRKNTVAEIVTEIAEIIGRPDLLKLGALPYREGEPEVILADNRRLTEEIGFKPRYDLHSGLEHTIHWWRKHSPPYPQTGGRTNRMT